MATHSLLALSRQFWADPSTLPKKYPHPVLVWEPPKVAIAIEITDVSGLGLDPGSERGAAVAIEVVKGSLPNAFPFGVTIGHAENNDVVVRHPLVSRFHAYVQQQANRKRFLVDTGSKNGTWLDGQRLVPSRPAELPSFAVLRLGQLELTYLEPEQLAGWLARQQEGSGR